MKKYLYIYYFAIVFIGGCSSNFPLDDNFKEYIKLIQKVEDSTVNYTDAILYSSLYKDKEYISLLKQSSENLDYAKKALYAETIPMKYKHRIIDTLQCLSTEDYIELGYELTNNFKYNTEVLHTYLSYGGKWGLIIHDKYNIKKVEHLLNFILDKRNSKKIKILINKSIKNGELKDQLWNMKIENKNPSSLYPYKLCN